LGGLNHGPAAELNFRFGRRYGVESGNFALVLRFTAFDPKRTWAVAHQAGDSAGRNFHLMG
jgi:hypothetical protein